MSKKRVVLITSGQPSLNPRLVKEADSLINAGYDVTVLYSYWNEWGTELDNILLPTKKWEAVLIGGSPQKNTLTYFLSRLIHKAAKIINQKTKGKSFASLAIARTSYFLAREAPQYKADLYIGHNLGALPATIKAAKVNKSLCGFDLEDFHRQEVSNDSTHPDVVLKKYLEEQYLPQADYISVSSPLIAEAYKKLFPAKSPIILCNVFNHNPNIKHSPRNPNDTIKLFWFSQTIGTNRGLNDAIDALILLKDYPFELHLLGYLPDDVRSIFTKRLLKEPTIKIYFHEPLPPDELAVFASQFDIGLALEPGFSINNELALSNKIFTYLQAGLGIVASDTQAQSDLINQYHSIGKVYQKGNAQLLADVLLFYHQNRDKLYETQAASLVLAREELNWEIEQQKFLAVVEKALNKVE